MSTSKITDILVREKPLTFADLPTELRLSIWRAALYTPRIACLRFKIVGQRLEHVPGLVFHPSGWGVNCVALEAYDPIPALWRASKESREVVQQYNQILSQIRLDIAEFGLIGTNVNPALDFVVLKGYHYIAWHARQLERSGQHVLDFSHFSQLRQFRTIFVYMDDIAATLDDAARTMMGDPPDPEAPPQADPIRCLFWLMAQPDFCVENYTVILNPLSPILADDWFPLGDLPATIDGPLAGPKNSFVEYLSDLEVNNNVDKAVVEDLSRLMTSSRVEDVSAETSGEASTEETGEAAPNKPYWTYAFTNQRDREDLLIGSLKQMWDLQHSKHDETFVLPRLPKLRFARLRSSRGPAILAEMETRARDLELIRQVLPGGINFDICCFADLVLLSGMQTEASRATENLTEGGDIRIHFLHLHPALISASIINSFVELGGRGRQTTHASALYLYAYF